jgi:hypothetical protein
VRPCPYAAATVNRPRSNKRTDSANSHLPREAALYCASFKIHGISCIVCNQVAMSATDEHVKRLREAVREARQKPRSGAQYEVPTSMVDRFCSWSSSNAA